jgi:hypothetical protein
MTMSGFDFDKAGQFPSQADATDWARRNGIDLRDISIRNVGTGEGVEVGLRRSTEPKHLEDNHNRRRDTFFD